MTVEQFAEADRLRVSRSLQKKQQIPVPRYGGLAPPLGASKMKDIPVPEYDDPKEVYAFFGLAYNMSQVIEQAVINISVILYSEKVTGITRKDINAMYEGYENKTFGQILRKARQTIGFPEDLEKDLADALEKRNYLAHQFFVVHDVDFLSEGGKKKMLDELIEILQLFNSVDSRMDELWEPVMEKFGITQNVINNIILEYKQRRT